MIELGERVFTEGRIEGIEGFTVPGADDRLIAIYQHRGCNGNGVEFYRIDIDTAGRLRQVLFRNKGGSKETTIYSGHAGAVISDNQVTFCGYDNVLGGVFCDSYIYDGQTFNQTRSLFSQGVEDQEIRISEARRALFEFLKNLNWKRYETAAFYYAGSDELLKRNSPNVSPNDRRKLFERYCAADGAACLMPQEVRLKGTDPSGALKFDVSFASRRDGLKIASTSRSEFRVEQRGIDFKILDLPHPPDFPQADPGKAP